MTSSCFHDNNSGFGEEGLKGQSRDGAMIKGDKVYGAPVNRPNGNERGVEGGVMKSCRVFFRFENFASWFFLSFSHTHTNTHFSIDHFALNFHSF